MNRRPKRWSSWFRKFRSISPRRVLRPGRAARSSTATALRCSTATAISAPRPAGRTASIHSRYAPPRASGTAPQRDAVAAARLQHARRQFVADRRPDESGHLCRTEARAAEGHVACGTHDVSLARHRLPAPAHPEPWRSRGQVHAVVRVRQRLCRPVRGARHAPRAPRHLARPSAHRAIGSRSTMRPRRQGRSDAAGVRAGAGTDIHQRCVLRPRARSRRSRGASVRPRSAAATTSRTVRPLVFHKGMRAAFKEHRAASRDVDRHRDLERDPQRGAVPLDGRPRRCSRPTTGRGALSLRGHSLVLDHVRPRRPDHGDADAVVPSGARARACCAGLPPARPTTSTRSPMPSRERSCTRCAAARWRRCARFRSVSITAAWIPRRCSCCSPASMPSAPATSRRCASCGRMWRRRSLDRRPGRSRPATASSNITGATRRAWSTRAGRIRSTRSSTPTARSRSGRSRCAKCRATSMPPSGWRRAAPGVLGKHELAERLDREADALAAQVQCRVLVRRHRHLCARARRREAPVPRAHLQRRAGADERHRAGRARRGGRARPDAAVVLLRLGHPHRRARGARDTIRCRITTARSGRTTTR